MFLMMKNKLIFVFALCLLITYILPELNFKSYALDTSSSSSAGPQITAETAIVADANSGYIYYQKNMHQKMYPASITKILTGLVAVENGKDSDVITINGDIGKGMPSDAARIYLEDGEQITQEEALYTMFLASANDSANALAIHNGGSVENFVSMMNARAKELGAADSNFSNANGLPDKNNITSAYDMAIITKKALEEPALMKYFGAKNYTMPATNKRKSSAYLTLHKMMKNTVYNYDGIVAGKTGWETMSGHTLVTAASRNGRTLICVVMKSESGSAVYKDTKALFDYAFTVPANSSSAQYLASPEKVLSGTTPAEVTKGTPKTAHNPIESSSGKELTVPIIVLICSTGLFILLLAFGRSARRSGSRVGKHSTEI